jgi:hypothetical protein
VYIPLYLEAYIYIYIYIYIHVQRARCKFPICNVHASAKIKVCCWYVVHSPFMFLMGKGGEMSMRAALQGMKKLCLSKLRSRTSPNLLSFFHCARNTQCCIGTLLDFRSRSHQSIPMIEISRRLFIIAASL